MARVILVVGAYAALTAYFTWPLLAVARTHFVSWEGLPVHDVMLVTWILRWETHALAIAPTSLFEGNALHPTPAVVTLSEHLLGILPLFAVPWSITRNPILALNAASLAAFVSSGVCMHLVVRRWTGSELAAFVAGVGFTFTALRLSLVGGGPHLLHVQYLPVIFWALEETATGRRWWPAVALAAALAMQCLSSFYLAYAALLVVVAYLVADALVRGIIGRWATWRALALGVGLGLGAFVASAIPYLRTAAVGRLAWDFSAGERSLWASAGAPQRLIPYAIGWPVFGLGALALPAFPRLLRTDRAGAVRVLALVLATAGGFVLARGPVEGSLFEWLRSVLPGFRNIRAPIRFAFVASFGASALAGLAVARLLASLQHRGPRVALALAAIAAVALPAVRAPSFRTWSVPTAVDLPPVYRWLATHGDGGALLELPLFSTTPGLSARTAGARAMYLSTFHWLPVLNGWTGYLPPTTLFLERYVRQLPDPAALARLVDCTGLRWILEHADGPQSRRPWIGSPALRLVDRFPDGAGGVDTLYETDLAPRGACRSDLFVEGSTADGNPVMPVRLAGSVGVAGMPDRPVASGETHATITVTNDGDSTWPCTSVDERVRVTLTARYESGGTVLAEQELPIPEDVRPGQRLVFGAWITHPPRRGPSTLRVTLAQPASTAPPLEWTASVDATPGILPPPASRGATSGAGGSRSDETS